jgi:hypothetical protein
MDETPLAGCVMINGITTHVCQDVYEDHERCACVICGLPFLCRKASGNISSRRASYAPWEVV